MLSDEVGIPDKEVGSDPRSSMDSIGLHKPEAHITRCEVAC
jgi:hypothetical protein